MFPPRETLPTIPCTGQWNPVFFASSLPLRHVRAGEGATVGASGYLWDESGMQDGFDWLDGMKSSRIGGESKVSLSSRADA
jgi:hypothetical protein